MLEKRWLWGLLALCALVVASYLAAMNAYWVGDDFNYVRPKSWSEVANFFNPVGRAQYRPLTWSTWAAGWALFGPNPTGWHLARLAQHLWNLLWCAMLVRMVLGRNLLALIAAAVFALHPAQPQTVTWLGGQADASFAMFWLPALALFVAWRRGAGKGSGRVLWALSGLLGFISMFGKEAAVTLPLASLLADLLFGQGWARWPVARGPGWWRSPAALLRVLADHSLFIVSALLYAGLRLFLFLTGQGRLMYGSDQLGFFSHALDVATGYIVLSLGFWREPPHVYAWPWLLKLGILLGAVAATLLLLRWLGRGAIFAAGWFGLTLLLTLQAVALRWFYLPALGVGVLVALALDRVLHHPRTAVRSVGALLGAFALAWLTWQTVEHNTQWVQAGEKARSILGQVRSAVPEPARPATFYMAGAPYGYKDVLLFNTGFDSAIHHVYADWRTIRAYSVEEDLAQMQQALRDPAAIGPNPLFLRYQQERIVRYPDLQSLLGAPP